MSNPTETGTFEVVLDAKPATAGAAEARKAGETLGGSLDKVKGGLDRFDSGMRETNKILRGMGGEMGGAKSQALDLLNVAADLGGAFATGGVVYLGMAAGAFIIGKVANAYMEATQGQRIFTQGIEHTNRQIASMTQRSLDPMATALTTLTKEMENYGKSARQIARDDAVFQAEALRIRKASLETNVGLMKERLLATQHEGMELRALGDHDGLEQLIERGKLEKAALLQAQLRLKETGSALEQADVMADRIDALVRRLEELDAKAKAKTGKPTAGVGAGKAEKDWYQGTQLGGAGPGSYMANGGQTMQLEGMRDAPSGFVNDYSSAIANLPDRSWSDPQVEAWKATQVAAQDATAAAKEYARTVAVDVAQDAFGAAIGGARDYFVMLAAGEEHAAEKALASTMMQVGNSLVAHGTAAVWEGIMANAAVPGSGVLLMAAGAGAIAAGIGMAAGGAAVSAKLSSGASGGGGYGGSAIGPANRFGRDSVRGGGGETHFVFNYGVAGPAPDEAARATADLDERATSRGFRAGTKVEVVRR